MIMGKRIHIIDDDQNIIDSLKIILESAGYIVTSQFTEKNAVANFINLAADLLIVDIMFPENPDAGFGIIKEFKFTHATKDVPILVHSAISEPGLRMGLADDSHVANASYLLSVNDFIEKPIRPIDLISKVNGLLN